MNDIPDNSKLTNVATSLRNQLIEVQKLEAINGDNIEELRQELKVVRKSHKEYGQSLIAIRDRNSTIEHRRLVIFLGFIFIVISGYFFSQGGQLSNYIEGLMIEILGAILFLLIFDYQFRRIETLNRNADERITRRLNNYEENIDDILESEDILNERTRLNRAYRKLDELLRLQLRNIEDNGEFDDKLHDRTKKLTDNIIKRSKTLLNRSRILNKKLFRQLDKAEWDNS